jgi:hypothetical protein
MCYSYLNCFTNLYNWVLSFCYENQLEDEKNGVNIDEQYMRFSLYEMKKKDLIDDKNDVNVINIDSNQDENKEQNKEQNKEPNIELIINSSNDNNNENEWDVMENSGKI